jgi:hypothetical protein
MYLSVIDPYEWPGEDRMHVQEDVLPKEERELDSAHPITLCPLGVVSTDA